MFKSAAAIAALATMVAFAPQATADIDFEQKLDRFAEAALEAYGLVPGLSLCVVRGGEPIYLAGFGLRDVERGLSVTPDTGFYIASATKSFTGMASSVLAAEGKLDLDATVSRYLPALALPAPLSPDDITLRALLTHRSGVHNVPVQRRLAFVDGLSRDEFLALMLSDSSPMPTDFIYSNLGYNVFGFLLEEVLGMPWQQVVTERVLQPAGMSSTSTSIEAAAEGDFAFPYVMEGDAFRRERLKHDAIMHAAGGLVSTASDLARWLIVNLNEGVIGGRTALSPAAVRDAHAKHAATDRDYDRFHRNGYGLGWYHSDFEGELLIHHFGGIDGYHAHVSFMPEHSLGVAVLMNTDAYGSSALTHMVAAYAYETLLGRPDVESRYRAELAERATHSQGRKQLEDHVNAAMQEFEVDRAAAGTEALLAAFADAQGQGVLRPGKVNDLGYALLKQDHVEAAIAVFRFNVDWNSDVPNSHDSLGDAYEQAGRLELARKSYARALALAEEQVDDNADLFRENLERVSKATH